MLVLVLGLYESLLFLAWLWPLFRPDIRGPLGFFGPATLPAGLAPYVSSHRALHAGAHQRRGPPVPLQFGFSFYCGCIVLRLQSILYKVCLYSLSVYYTL